MTLASGPSVSLKNYIDACLDDNSFSKDIPFLCGRYKLVPLFVYGAEKEKFSEDFVLRGCKQVGVGTTSADIFELKVTQDAEPVAFTNPGTQDSSRISGELYLVSPETIIECDQRFSNGVIFHRRQQMISWFPIEEKSAKIKTQYVSEAYIYLGDREYWKERRSKTNQYMRFAKLFFPSKGGKSYYLFTAECDQPNKDAMMARRKQCL